MMTFIILALALTGVVLILNEYGWTDLTGGTRNNLVFEERNKSYGAYEIRQKYSNRLLVAFIGALGFISIAAVSPKFFMNGKTSLEDAKGPNGPSLVTEVTNADKPEEKKEEEIKENKVTQPSKPALPQNNFIKPEVTDKPVEKKDSSDAKKPIVNDGSVKGDSTLAGSGNTPPGGGGNGTGGTGECLDCPKKEPYTGPEVDKMAELKNYAEILGRSIHIPQQYIEMGGTGGRLYVSFIVDENGNVSSAQIKRGLDPTLDNEVKRAINAMPRWTPAVLQGKNVPVRMIIPVNIQVK